MKVWRWDKSLVVYDGRRKEGKKEGRRERTEKTGDARAEQSWTRLTPVCSPTPTVPQAPCPLLLSSLFPLSFFLSFSASCWAAFAKESPSLAPFLFLFLFLGRGFRHVGSFAHFSFAFNSSFSSSSFLFFPFLFFLPPPSPFLSVSVTASTTGVCRAYYGRRRKGGKRRGR